MQDKIIPPSGIQRDPEKSSGNIPGISSAQTPKMSSTSPEVIFNKTLELAEHGDAQSQAKIADMYTAGKGTVVNYYQAIKWLKSSAVNGIGYSAYLIGELYLTGRFNGRLMVEPDVNEALKWYNLSVHHGCKFGAIKIDQINEMRHYPDTDLLRNLKIMKDKTTQTDETLFFFIDDHFM